MAVRVDIDLQQPAAGLDARLTDYQGRGLLLWPVISLPADQAGLTPWRALLKQWLSRHRSQLAVLELRVTEQTLPVAGFAIQAAATDLRAAAPSARLAVGGPIAASGSLPRLIDASLAPYVDLVAVPSRELADRAIASLKGLAPAIKAALVDQRLPADPEAARTALIDLHIVSLATDVVAIAAGGESACSRGRGRRSAAAGCASRRRRRGDRPRGLVADLDRRRTGRLGADGSSPAVREPHLRDVPVLPGRRERGADGRRDQRADRRDAGGGGPDPRQPGARDRLPPRRPDRASAGAAHGPPDADRLQRGRRRRLRRAQRDRRGASPVGRGDHRAAPAAAGVAGAAGPALCRAGADGAAFPADRGRPRLRRGHRESLLLRARRRGMGGAVVRGQRLALGTEPAAVSAPPGREGPVAAAAVALRSRTTATGSTGSSARTASTATS